MQNTYSITPPQTKAYNIHRLPYLPRPLVSPTFYGTERGTVRCSALKPNRNKNELLPIQKNAFVDITHYIFEMNSTVHKGFSHMIRFNETKTPCEKKPAKHAKRMNDKINYDKTLNQNNSMYVNLNFFVHPTLYYLPGVLIPLSFSNPVSSYL